MKRISYRDSILSIIAVLLAANVWVQISSGPAFSHEALAQDPRGIPNAGYQRKEMIDGIREIGRRVDGLAKVIESGKLKVEVSNFKDLEELQKKSAEDERRATERAEN